MTVPLDKLYNFLNDVVNQDMIIYRWYPHGSKLLDDLCPLAPYSWFKTFTEPMVMCHDQEPLDYYQYSTEEISKSIIKLKSIGLPYSRKKFKKMNDKLKFVENYIREMTGNHLNIYNKYVLVHSEKNSTAIEDYVQHGAVPVYYFGHALIARDWFRYAEVDPCALKKDVKKDFLVYQRAWDGSREYRLKFSELLINSELHKNCLSKFAPVSDNGIHYLNHQYKNNRFQIQRRDLEHHFTINDAPSWASADYNSKDYIQTLFEVVLETLFDDQRWHLTEKIFRPIACGQPFILASTPGSLKYLKSYGFKTFGDYIDESYDDVVDPIERLAAVTSTMKSISALTFEQKEKLAVCLQPIVEFNKNWFFSKQFFNNVVDEYQVNMLKGLAAVKQQRGACLERWAVLREKDIDKYLITEEEYQELVKRI